MRRALVLLLLALVIPLPGVGAGSTAQQSYIAAGVGVNISGGSAGWPDAYTWITREIPCGETEAPLPEGEIPCVPDPGSSTTTEQFISPASGTLISVAVDDNVASSTGFSACVIAPTFAQCSGVALNSYTFRSANALHPTRTFPAGTVVRVQVYSVAAFDQSLPAFGTAGTVLVIFN